MTLIEFVEKNLNCKISKDITETNLKEFLSFMKVDCYSKEELVKKLSPYEDFDNSDDEFDDVVFDYFYIKVDDDCYINEEDWDYFKESKYECGVKYLDYTIDKFIEEYNTAMNDENFQDDFDLFPF